MIKGEHDLGEQEEQLKMDEDTAAHMAKLNLLWTQSIKNREKIHIEASDGMNS